MTTPTPTAKSKPAERNRNTPPSLNGAIGNCLLLQAATSRIVTVYDREVVEEFVDAILGELEDVLAMWAVIDLDPEGVVLPSSLSLYDAMRIERLIEREMRLP